MDPSKGALDLCRVLCENTMDVLDGEVIIFLWMIG